MEIYINLIDLLTAERIEEYHRQRRNLQTPVARSWHLPGLVALATRRGRSSTTPTRAARDSRAHA